MGRGQAFVEVLDEMLDGYESNAAAAPAFPAGIATTSLYWNEQRLAPRRTVPVPRPPRPSRTLSMKQLDALDTLIGLGAQLDRDFTDAELRRVFRTLALRYHPDRHVDATEAERTRLAVLFARAHDAYELLKTATPPTLH